MDTCKNHDHTVCCLKDVENDMIAIKKFLGIDQGTIEAPPDSLVGQFLALKYSIRNGIRSATYAVCAACLILIVTSYYINRAPRKEVADLALKVERAAEAIKAVAK